MQSPEQDRRDPRILRLPPDESSPGMTVREFDLAAIPGAAIPFAMSRFSVAPGCTTEIDRHAVAEIWHVATGQGVLRYDGEPLRVRTGDAVYFGPWKTHSIHNDTQEPLEVCSIWWRQQQQPS